MLSVEDRGAVRWLSIDRRDRMNAIPPDGWAQLGQAFADFEASSSRTLVITGSGGNFCSGADLAPQTEQPIGGVAANASQMRAFGQTAVALHRLGKPTVAAVDGVAAGAGMNLALGCDVVVATDRARFSEIFVRRGFGLDFGGTWLLPRLVGLAKARELALTGRIVDAPEALDIGLVTQVVAVDELESAVSTIAEKLAMGAPLAQRFIKSALDRSFELGFEQVIELENQAQSILLATEDAAEGVVAFQQKRRPQFRGR